MRIVVFPSETEFKLKRFSPFNLNPIRYNMDSITMAQRWQCGERKKEGGVAFCLDLLYGMSVGHRQIFFFRFFNGKSDKQSLECYRCYQFYGSQLAKLKKRYSSYTNMKFIGYLQGISSWSKNSKQSKHSSPFLRKT